MPRLILDLTKTVEENAAQYFEEAKKIKRKIKGAEEALQHNIIKLKELETKKDKFEAEEQKKVVLTQRKKEWYEKFRWFMSSDGLLVIGGRDATSNEVVIKKHTEKNDLVFHTDMAGSPFFVIKSENKKIPENTVKEVADATCTFSRAWKLGLQTSDVFYVFPEQVSKKTKAGEYMGKGAFMVYGKSNYIENKINLAVGVTKDRAIMSGPLESIKKNCEKYIVLNQGNEKASSVAKKINYKLGGNLDLDEIIRALPAGMFGFQ
ncbi:MAG: NFACT RNA binding domain-containing protein [Nanoarchaeota archaeon]